VVRLNGALLNVLQTNVTDVNVTLRCVGGKRFEKGPVVWAPQETYVSRKVRLLQMLTVNSYPL
jgi:hypothetical protein